MAKIIKGIVPERCTHKIVCKDQDFLQIKRLVYPENLKKVMTVEKAKTFGEEFCVYDFPEGNLYEVSEIIYEKFEKEIKKLKGTIYVIPQEPIFVLILSTRTDQIIDLCLSIRSKNIKVDSLWGSKKDYDPEAQILVAQEKKAGTGFSDTKFQVLYYASDITNIEQPFGRIRKEGGIHFDFVDSHPTIEKHYKTRRAYYRRVGSEVVEKAEKNTLESIRKELYENF